MKLCEACQHGFFGTPARCPVCSADLSDQPELTGHELAGMAIGDRYELTELLGEGAMGWVYRGVHRTLDRSVAIKLLKVAGEAERELVNRFEQEARAVSRLHHPHIVSVIDFGRTPGGIFYLVTEYLEGNTLADLLAEQGPLPIARILGIFHQILAAVEEAHGNQVIHRDLKPENIAITPLRSGEDFVKVLDFGIAMLADDQRPRMTAQGSTVGTPGFMAPETIVEGKGTEQTDIYALGNILYEMLVGAPPFEHEWPMALLTMHLNEPTPRLNEVAPDQGYPAALEQVVSRAMAKRPAERYHSIAELRAELLAAIEQIGPVALRCDRCSRPRDPDSGLCSLHGRTTRPAPPAHPDSGPPLSLPTPTPAAPPVDGTSATLVSGAGVDRASLAVAIAGTEAVRRRAEADQLAAFLLGEHGLLEVTGSPGIGKSHLLEGLARGASVLGLPVVRLDADPHGALRPWYPVRRAVGLVLDCEPEPRSADRVTSRARQRGLSAEHVVGLALLFGFAHAQAPAHWFERARLIRRSAAAALRLAAAEAPGICIIADDVAGYDRASQSFLRTLPRRLGGPHDKLAVSSDGAFWPQRGDRMLVRPRPIQATDVAAMIDQAGLGDYADKATLAARVADVAQGNPFHARQALLAHGEGHGLDGGLTDLLERRLGDLPEDATHLLRTVCALGREVPLERLEGLVDESVILLATDLLIRRGYLVSGPERSLSPSHTALSRAVLDGLTHAELVARHRAIAERLREVGASVFVRARHAFEADGAEEALELLSSAGDEACRWSDVETAALVHYRRAAHVARWHLLWSEQEPDYLELSLKLGSALRASGHRRAAEVVFREVLGAAGPHARLQDRARQGLEALERG